MNKNLKHFGNRILKPAIVLVLAVTLLITIVATTNKPAYACRCASFPSPQEALNNATAVFAGRVISVNTSGSATFSVSQIWKGEVLQNLVVTTPSGTSCGFNFQLGQDYLVYASGEKNNLTTALCDRTKELSSAELELPLLGRGISLLTPSAPAYSIAIRNPSFEQPSFADGSFNIASITDWSVINTGNPGVFNPSSSSFNFVPDGVQTLYSNGGTVFQTLTTALAPKTLYTLGVSVGRRRDFTDFPGFSVELRAGGTVLASANQTHVRLPQAGKFERLTVYYVSPDTVGAGQLLEIRLKSAGAQTNFDLVTLDARPIQ
ncbi:MAG TPA: hypothetical protein V6D25_15485 [Leptolyngbyaceae cyanobacterium]